MTNFQTFRNFHQLPESKGELSNFQTFTAPVYLIYRAELKVSSGPRKHIKTASNFHAPERLHKALQPRQGKYTGGLRGRATGERGRHRRERGRLAPTSTRRPPAPVGTVSDPALRPQAEVSNKNRDANVGDAIGGRSDRA